MSGELTSSDSGAKGLGPGQLTGGEPVPPIAGGRRLGDDPFLPDEGLFWWLPRSFSLLVVAVALMMLGAHFFGSADGDSSTPGQQLEQSKPAVVVPTAAVSPPPAQLAPVVAPPSQPPVLAGQLQPVAASSVTSTLDASRSYNARRRAFLQQGEALLSALPPEGTGPPSSERDRRAIRELIQRMDTPAR